MKRMVPVIIVVSASVVAALWLLLLPSELDRARQELRTTCDELQAAHPELLADPRGFYEREGTNAFPLCVEIREKLNDLGDASDKDERGDWWFPFEMGPGHVDNFEDEEIARLLTIALEESEPLFDDVARVLECDYLLAPPNDKFDFDSMKPVWVALFLGNRIEAHCRLGHVDSARREAEMLIRLISMTDYEATTEQAMFYHSKMTSLAWQALTNVIELTRDAAWFSQWHKLAQPEVDHAAALRNERIAIFGKCRLAVEASDKVLEDAADPLFSLGGDNQNAAHMLQSFNMVLVEYFRFADKFADGELDLTAPGTTAAMVEHIESLDDGFTAFALTLTVQEMEENALQMALLRAAYELRSLELTGHALDADTPEVKDLLKRHPLVKLWPGVEGISLRIRRDHPRTTTDEDPPRLEYKFLSERE